MFTFYAIRHKPSGYFLPFTTTRTHSHNAPELNGGKFGPRLHYRRRSVINALSAYMQGKFEPHHDGGLDIIKCPDRIKGEYEIVTYEVKEVA